MRTLSSHTQLTDPYRAGIELGEAIAPLIPEVVFLFSSIHLSAPDLLEGLHDALGRNDILVIGNSGDGCYETAGAFDHGAAVLALNSEGAVRWRIESLEGLSDNVGPRLGQLFSGLSDKGEPPSLAYLVSDFRVDTGVIEKLLRFSVPYPVIGGLAMDDRHWEKCHVYMNRRVLDNSLVVLAAYGRLPFSIFVGNTQTPVGKSARIDSSGTNQIHRIDGISGQEFIERETGKPLLQTDRGIICIKVRNSDTDNEEWLRSIRIDDSGTPGSLRFFGGIPDQASVQACRVHPPLMISEVEQIAAQANELCPRAVAALVISCTGRKALLGKQIECDIAALGRAFPWHLPVAGFPSSGEIAPLRKNGIYTRNLMHNMTYVLLVIENEEVGEER